MDKISDLFSHLSQLFKWYFIVMPWEQAILVRAGKNKKLLPSGMYFKIPLIDRVYINTTRRRIIDAPIQTLTTLDGKTITIKCSVSYEIGDMIKLYEGLYHPETTLLNIVMGSIGEHISSNNSESISQASIKNSIDIENKGDEWGLKNMSVMINNYCIVRTYRLIQDHTTFYMDQLRMGHEDEKR